MVKLDAKACGIALGIVAAATMMLLGTLDVMFYWGDGLGKILTVAYLGYRPTMFGVIFCAMWGFVEAFILGYAFAWLYNRVTEENKIEMDKKIAELAKKIWESKGKPQGTSQDDWREAEKRIKGK